MKESPILSKRSDVYSIVTNRIIEALEEGVLPWKKPWGNAGIPTNLISKKSYRGINLMLLLSLKYEKLAFLTWNQVQQLGGSVKKGEHGHPVVFYKRTKVMTAENVEETYSVLRYYMVFNVSQCEGIPENILQEIITQDNLPIRSCEDIIAKMPNAPRIRHDGIDAQYHIEEDVINMPERKIFDTSAAYYCTLYHEMIHATGHSSRLNRKSLTRPTKFGTAIYSLEELVAEIGAAYLANLSGIEPQTIDSSAAYIRGWLVRLNDDAKFFVRASTLAQKAVDYILHDRHEYE